MAALSGFSGGHVGQTDEVHTTARNRIGTRGFDDNRNEYVYLKGIASVAVGSWVNMDVTNDGIVALLDTDVAATLVGRIAVAMAAIVASSWGWFCIYTGPGSSVPGLSLTSATDAKNAFATATAGSVDDANAGAETLVNGAFYVGAVNESTLLANFALNYPYMHGLTLD